MEIFISEISNIPKNHFPERLQTLRKAFKDGVIFPPILVRKATKGYWLLDGAHRIKISLENNIKTIIAEVVS